MMALVWAALLAAALTTGGVLLRRPGQMPRAVPDGGVADVAVVIPARDEQLSLPQLLASLRDLRPCPSQVVVVDDESVDDTARLARDAGARVVASGSPPPGWTGKAWACQRGVEESSASTLLFLDADTVLAPDALGVLMAAHTDDGGLLSIQPFHRTVRAYEQLSAYFNVIPLMASGAFTGRPPARPMAFGPCLFTSREDYEQAGGHTAVRAEVLDDARLAGAYVAAGLPVVCRLGGDVVGMRMYPGGPRQLVEGWTKNMASGAGQASRWSAAGSAFWLCGHWLVVGAAASWVVGSLVSSTAVPLLPVPLVLAGWLAVALQFRHLLRRVGSFRWWAWALFPLPLLGFGALFAWSVVLTSWRGEVRWRGRVVSTPRARAG